MLSKEGTARRLTDAQRELTKAIWINRIEGEVLEAISKGRNLCNIEAVPDYIANCIEAYHPDWKVWPKSSKREREGNIEISW